MTWRGRESEKFKCSFSLSTPESAFNLNLNLSFLLDFVFGFNYKLQIVFIGNDKLQYNF